MTVSCSLCDFDGTNHLFESRDRVHGLPGVFSINRCTRCSAVFIHPWLTDEQLSTYYPEHYGRYRHSRSLERKSYAGIRRFILENYYHYPPLNGKNTSVPKKWAAFLLSFVMARGAIPYRGEGRFLDVGCAGGSYLYRLRQWGWNVIGVEPSAVGAEQARSLGLDVRQGQVEDAGFPDGFFDVARLNHVLEHLTGPKRTLREIHRILKSDGILYLTLPNTGSLNFWLFQENWYGLDPPRHVISYCPRTLGFLCSATGFEIAEISFQSGAFNFVRSVKYLLEDKGRHRLGWLHRIDWPRNKPIRRVLKPFFYLVDLLRIGDVMVATLRKERSNGS
ncbi:MAG: class I SAM-dependent methyltransferase [Candidatus Binatia bacterium]